jgi:hypothetical protein
MADFTDWLARNFFITQDQEDTSAQVAASQQARLDRIREEGKISALEYVSLSEKVQDTGTQLFDEQLGHRGAPALFATVPWWVWAVAVLAAGIYFWPIIRPFASRFTKRT